MKKKILFVNGHLEVGGVEKSLIDFLNHLDPDKYELYLLLLQSRTGEYLSLVPKHVTIEHFNTDSLSGSLLKNLAKCMIKLDWRGLKFRLTNFLSHWFGHQVYKWLRKDFFKGVSFDISIGFRPGYSSLISTYTISANHHFTWWHHGAFLVDSLSYQQLSNDNDRTICVSNGTRDLLIQNGIPPKHISVIPNMIDVSTIKAKSKKFWPDYMDGYFNIVSVGRLSEEKQYRLIPLIAASIKSKLNIKFKWHIIGDGDCTDEIKAIIVENSLEDCVILYGNKPNPYPYIVNADLFVHPSRVESQGLAVLEALTLGVPCVVGKTLGTTEFIKDRINGLIVEPDLEHLQEAVLEIIKDKALIEHIKNNSKCPSEYEVDNVIQKFEQLI